MSIVQPVNESVQPKSFSVRNWLAALSKPVIDVAPVTKGFVKTSPSPFGRASGEQGCFTVEGFTSVNWRSKVQKFELARAAESIRTAFLDKATEQ